VYDIVVVGRTLPTKRAALEIMDKAAKNMGLLMQI
jgi:hypothetical protein